MLRLALLILLVGYSADGLGIKDVSKKLRELAGATYTPAGAEPSLIETAIDFVLGLLGGEEEETTSTVEPTTIADVPGPVEFDKTPGYKVRIAKSGLDYVAELAGEAGRAYIVTTPIPPMSFDESGSQLDLTNLKITEFEYDSSTISLSQPNKLSYEMKGIQTGVTGDVEGTVNVVTTFDVDGFMTTTLDNTDLTLDLVTGRDNFGRITAQLTNCDFKVRKLNIQLTGNSAATLASLFESQIEDMAKPEIEKAVCDEAQTMADDLLAGLLDQQPNTIPIYNGLSIDFSPVADPIFGPDYIDIMGDGETVYQGQRSVGLSPPPSLDWTDSMESTKMANVFVTDYVFKSLVQQAHAHGLLNLVADKDNDPYGFLATTCASGCIGSFVGEGPKPNLKDAYPDTNAVVRLNSTAPPVLTFASDRIYVAAEGVLTLAVETFPEVVDVAMADVVMDAVVTMANPPVQDGYIDSDIVIHNMQPTEKLSSVYVPWQDMNWGLLVLIEHRIQTEFAKTIAVPLSSGVRIFNDQTAIWPQTMQLEGDIEVDISAFENLGFILK